MPKVVRPWLTAGVAVIGAGAIAVAPSSSPQGQVRVENSAVVQNPTHSPLQYYPDVVSRSAANAGHLVDEYLAQPLPIVSAIADNQHRAVVEVLRAAAELDPEAFAHAVFAAANQPVETLARVVGSGEPFGTANSMLVRLTMPAASGVLAGAAGATEIVDAAADLDPVRVAGGLINLPARTADGLLNGRVGSGHDEYFGLLGSVVEAPVSEDISGPVDYLIHSLQDIGDTIAVPAPQNDTVAGAAPAHVLDAPPTPAAEDKDADDSPSAERPSRPATSRDDDTADAGVGSEAAPARGRSAAGSANSSPRGAKRQDTASSQSPRHQRATAAASPADPPSA
ncbi:hypothetical protein GR927_20680 [Mycolicibacterium sp. 3033]|nr:hypothetical protein [Mycolicibacterium aurantiacum]